MIITNDNQLIELMRSNIYWTELVTATHGLLGATVLPIEHITTKMMAHTVRYDWSRKTVIAISDSQEYLDHVVTIANKCQSDKTPHGTPRGEVYTYKVNPDDLSKRCAIFSPVDEAEPTHNLVPGVCLGMPDTIPENAVIIDFGHDKNAPADRSDVTYHHYPPKEIEITGPAHNNDCTRFFDPSRDTWSDLIQYEFLSVYQRSYNDGINVATSAVQMERPLIICGGTDHANDIASNVAVEYLMKHFRYNLKDCRNIIFKALPSLNPSVRWTGFLCDYLINNKQDFSCAYSTFRHDWMYVHRRIMPDDPITPVQSTHTMELTHMMNIMRNIHPTKRIKPSVYLIGGKIVRKE